MSVFEWTLTPEQIKERSILIEVIEPALRCNRDRMSFLLAVSGTEFMTEYSCK